MIFNVSVSPSGALPRAPLGGIACPIPPKTPRAVKGDRRRSRDKYAPVPLNEPPPRAANSLTTEKPGKGIVLAGAEPRVFVGRIKEKRRFTRLSRLCSNGCVTTCLSNGRPYGLGGLSRRDRQRQSVPPCLLILLVQRSPRRVGRPTSATCGHAGARRGWQKAERCCRVIISGRTCGDMRSRKIPRLLWGRKPAATQRLPRAAASASPRRMVSKGFFFLPHLLQ